MSSGGIVLIATPRANSDGSFDASTNNVVVLKRLRGNEPADIIVTDEASVPNLIVANRCRTSAPDGLCDFQNQPSGDPGESHHRDED